MSTVNQHIEGKKNGSACCIETKLVTNVPSVCGVGSGSEEEDSDSLGGGPLSFDDVSGAEEGAVFAIGDKLMVQDCTDLEWYKGRVIEAVPGQLRVHFVGWSSVWDEWIEDDSPRLKQWSWRTVRAKEDEVVASDNGQAKESWMCTADMRGFEHGARNAGQRVRIRDRFSPRNQSCLCI